MVRRLLLAVCLLAAVPAAAHEGVRSEIALLDAALKDRPGDLDLLLKRAVLYRRQGELDRAMEDLRAVAQKAPARRELLVERGLTQALRGDPGAAEADLTRFLETGAPSADALWARGKIREAGKRFALARADYAAAVKLRPDPELYLARGRMDEAMGQLARAAAGYEEGLRALGGAVVLRLALVRVEMARGHFDRVTGLVNEVLATAPVKADWLLLRADAHAKAGRARDAERDRIEALREVNAAIDRRQTDLARLTRARAYLALAREADAIADLELLARRNPPLPDVKALLAEAQERAARRRIAAAK